MILYITAYENTDIITEIVENTGQTVLDAIQSNRLNFTEFVRKRLDQLQSASHILIDLQALEDTEEEIVNAIKNLRLVYDNKRIIIFASGKEKGDPLLAQLFGLGIYDLVVGNSTKVLEQELDYCLRVGKNFRDSLEFQDQNHEENKKAEKEIIERIVVKNEVITKVCNAMIGIAGTQERCGTSHHVIMSANYLKSKGFKVAVLECAEYPVFGTYAALYGYDRNQVFIHDKVVYYPVFNLDRISQIYAQNYDIVLIDFGVIRSEILNDYQRCMMKIVITGSQPYELEKVSYIFEKLEEEVFSKFFFVFQDCGKSLKKMIRKNMEGQKVFFTPLVADPFKVTQDEEIVKLYATFVKSENGEAKKKKKRGWMFKKWVG